MYKWALFSNEHNTYLITASDSIPYRSHQGQTGQTNQVQYSQKAYLTAVDNNGGEKMETIQAWMDGWSAEYPF